MIAQNPKVCFLEPTKDNRYKIIGLEPEDDRALIITGDGVFEFFSNTIAEVVRKVPQDKFPKIKEEFTVFINKLPESMFLRALEFLRQVYKEHKAEGCIVYFYNKETGEYKEFVPKQEVAGAKVDYEIEPEIFRKFREEGFVIVGTIHSHPDFGASQSSTDKHDEDVIDGWHITMGKIVGNSPEYHCRWVFRGTTFPAKLDEIVDFEETKPEIPSEWLTQVSKKVYPTYQNHYAIQGSSQRQIGFNQGYNKGHNAWLDDIDDYDFRKTPTQIQRGQTVYLYTKEEDILEEIECTITIT